MQYCILFESSIVLDACCPRTILCGKQEERRSWHQCSHPTATLNTSRLRSNRQRQVGDRESPTCFGSGRRILRPVLGQVGDKLVVSDVLRPILAHIRSKYSNTQHRIRNLEPQSRQTQQHQPKKNASDKRPRVPRL